MSVPDQVSSAPDETVQKVERDGVVQDRSGGGDVAGSTSTNGVAHSGMDNHVNGDSDHEPIPVSSGEEVCQSLAYLP